MAGPYQGVRRSRAASHNDLECNDHGIGHSGM
jgi:hypothetical protein